MTIDLERGSMSAKVWEIKGRLRHTGSDTVRRQNKWTDRTVRLAFDTFPEVTVAKRALLHHWSDKPHEVEVFSIRPLKVEVYAGVQEQMEAVWLPIELNSVAAIGWLATELRHRTEGPGRTVPDWFPEPPEWLELWERALRETKVAE